MLQSMTGYGRSNVEIGTQTYTIELKGVNHRYLDIKVRMPREYYQLEDVIRKEIGKVFSRGRIDVYVHYEKNAGRSQEIKVDKELANAYVRGLVELAEYCNLKQTPSLEFVATRPEVMTVTEPEVDWDDAAKLLLSGVTSACREMLKMRTYEGTALAVAIDNQLQEIAALRAQVEKRAPLVVEEYKVKLHDRIRGLLEKSIEVNQDRLANEIAYFADRASIDEELVRLASHLEQFTDIMQKGGVIGRKMDFIVQEMNREVNTMGSKSADMEITRAVVNMKSVIEKIREQVQNIE